MSLVMACPACQRQLRVSPELQGQQVQCPTCGHRFDSLNAAPAPADNPPGDRLGPATGLAPCPYCAEPIPSEATSCPHCGEDWREGRPSPAREEFQEGRPLRRDWEPHRGGLLLGLGIASIVLSACAPGGLLLGVIAWVMGSGDLKKIRGNQMEPSGFGLTQGGLVCGIVGTILSALSLCVCTVYIGFGAAMFQVVKTVPPPPPVKMAPAPAPLPPPPALPPRNVPGK